MLDFVVVFFFQIKIITSLIHLILLLNDIIPKEIWIVKKTAEKQRNRQKTQQIRNQIENWCVWRHLNFSLAHSQPFNREHNQIVQHLGLINQFVVLNFQLKIIIGRQNWIHI